MNSEYFPPDVNVFKKYFSFLIYTRNAFQIPSF